MRNGEPVGARVGSWCLFHGRIGPPPPPPTTSLFCVFILVGGEVEDHEKVAVHLDGEQILTSSVSCKLCSDTVNT
jgi:hypothetical protein